MDVLLQVIAAPVVLFGVIIDWVYSIVVIASNFLDWLFSLVSWLIKVVSAFFSALFNPVTVSVSEIKGLVGDKVTGSAFDKVIEVVTFMYSKVPDGVWVGLMAFIGLSIVWRSVVGEKETTD